MDIVKTGKEKQSAYRNEFARLKKAMGNEFYLEAIAICYAIIEDRLIAFFHHAGIVSRNNDNLKINRKVYPYLRKLLGKDEDCAIKIKDVSVKADLVWRLLTMREDDAKSIDDYIAAYPEDKKRHIATPGYMIDLYRQIHRTLDIRNVTSIFLDFQPWRDNRNQLIHALLSKTVVSSAITKKQCAEEGGRLARAMDNYLVKPFKKGNKLRNKYRIQ